MPSHPIATWIMPCSSGKVQVSSTSRRRHTIGLIPSSHTLTCTTPTASGMAGGGSGSTARLGCFEGQGTSRPYRARSYAVAGTTYFLMVPQTTRPGKLRLTNRSMHQRSASVLPPRPTGLRANKPLGCDFDVPENSVDRAHKLVQGTRACRVAPRRRTARRAATPALPKPGGNVASPHRKLDQLLP